jgi:iron complex transport system permease protein
MSRLSNGSMRSKRRCSLSANATTAHTTRGRRPATGRLPDSILLPIGVCVVAVLATLSLMFGSHLIAPDALVSAVFSPTGSENDLIVTGVRIPRTLLGIAVGAALAVAGVIMQALTRNPLAEPGILGVNAGASFAVALGLTVLGFTQFSSTLWLAFVGAAVASLAVTALAAAASGPQSVARLVLGGVAIGAVLAGATAAISMMNPRAYAAMRLWEAGSLAGRDLPIALATLIIVGVGLALALGLGPSLNVLLLGEDAASALGARVGIVRGLGLLAIIVLCGAATAAAGPIVFVGLMVPHAVRALVGTNQVRVLLYSLLAGPILLLAADLIARTIIRPQELPVGVVTAFLGAPLLIALVLSTRRMS